MLLISNPSTLQVLVSAPFALKTKLRDSRMRYFYQTKRLYSSMFVMVFRTGYSTEGRGLKYAGSLEKVTAVLVASSIPVQVQRTTVPL